MIELEKKERMQVNSKASAYRSRMLRHGRRCLPFYVLGALLLLIGLHHNNHLGGRSSQVVDVIVRELSNKAPGIPKAFPRKIWQTWKVDATSYEEREKNTARTWMLMNPTYRYEVLTDSSDMLYIENNFGPSGINRPDIVEMYRTLTAKIIKADLLRYLIMYIEGGVYTDIDVAALKPIDLFIPEKYDEKDVDLVVGVEIDQSHFNDHPILGKKSESFCQWTFMSKPRVPVMLKLVDHILAWLNDVATRQNVPVSEIHLDFDEVIAGTGPTAFTKAILSEMSEKAGRTVTWKDFHNLRESKLVGGVLVLTVEAFCAGQGHSDSGTHEGRNVLVQHHYHASGWPKSHPRYKHPVYGEVEQCNWNIECVKAWDANMTAWETLPKTEQTRLITEKEERDKKIQEEEERHKKEMEEEEKRKEKEKGEKSRWGWKKGD